jgi:hypothetical protein
VVRVEVQSEKLAIQLARKGSGARIAIQIMPFLCSLEKDQHETAARDYCTKSSGQDMRPIRSETRAALVTSIAYGRRWLDEIVTGKVVDVEQIAAREKCSVRQVNMTISLAFLSPTLVKAAIDGRLPRGIGIARLRDAPAEWSRQHAMLGLAS